MVFGTTFNRAWYFESPPRERLAAMGHPMDSLSWDMAGRQAKHATASLVSGLSSACGNAHAHLELKAIATNLDETHICPTRLCVFGHSGQRATSQIVEVSGFCQGMA